MLGFPGLEEQQFATNAEVLTRFKQLSVLFSCYKIPAAFSFDMKVGSGSLVDTPPALSKSKFRTVEHCKCRTTRLLLKHPRNTVAFSPQVLSDVLVTSGGTSTTTTVILVLPTTLMSLRSWQDFVSGRNSHDLHLRISDRLLSLERRTPCLYYTMITLFAVPTLIRLICKDRE